MAIKETGPRPITPNAPPTETAPTSASQSAKPASTASAPSPALPPPAATGLSHNPLAATESLKPNQGQRPYGPKQATKDAQALRNAMKGLGTDEDAIYTILENRSPAERRAIEATFDRRYGATSGPLRAWLRDDLSGSELQRALDGLNSGRSYAPEVGSPEFNLRLDSLTQSSVREGNRSQLLFDGVESFEARKRLILSATDSVYLQTFIFDDDATGWETARLLAQRAQEGLDVRVIFDGFGSNRADNEIFEFMRASGVKVEEYGDPLRQFWDLNDRWHEKHLIVDNQIAIEGGMNIANEYALGGSGKLVFSRGPEAEMGWRDLDVQVEGPVVADIAQGFYKNWEELTGNAERRAPVDATVMERFEDGSQVRFVQHRPDEDGDQNTKALYLQAIRSATDSIVIENAYFLPPAELRNALINAANRGVTVKIMTNSRETNDMGPVSDASRYYYDDLVEAGAQVFEKQDATLHSKTMTVDGKFSIIGSVNLNGRSQWRDSESVVAVSSENVAYSLNQRFQQGLDGCLEITQTMLERESILTDLKQWALSASRSRCRD